MSVPRPYAFLAELTYRCPLHCPYCSNPARARSGEELTTNEWRRVFRETTELGVLQVGGEPLVRRDLAELVHAARETRLYTNLITSGIGLNESRADEIASGRARLGAAQFSGGRCRSSRRNRRGPARINSSCPQQRIFAQRAFHSASISSFIGARDGHRPMVREIVSGAQSMYAVEIGSCEKL